MDSLSTVERRLKMDENILAKSSPTRQIYIDVQVAEIIKREWLRYVEVVARFR